MAKRGRRDNGEGTYVKHGDGRHEWRIPIPNGNGKYRSVSAKTYRELTKKRDALKEEMQRGLVNRDKQTVAQYLTDWLDSQRAQVKATTWERYEEQVRLHIIPHLGHIGLRDLKGEQVKKMEATLLKTKPKGRKRPYSPTTVKQTHVVLHKALKDAYRMRLVADNVTEMFDAPRTKQPEMRFWSPEEARTFLSFVRGHRLEALFVLSLATGLRQGEALGLKWQDVNFEKATVSVARTIRYVVGQKFRLSEPKTPKSKRTIKLNTPTLAALKAHRVRQAAEQLAAGADWAQTGLIFTTGRGTPLAAQNLDKSFTSLITQAGVPAIRWHDMRHTAATILLSHGANIKAVSELLGHSDISITLRTYVHVLPSMTEQMADIMGGALFG